MLFRSEIRAFLKASDEIHFEGLNREEIYAWVNQTLRQQNYGELGRRGRGLVRSYIGKMTGLSRAQGTRLISQYLQGEEVKLKPYRRRRFPTLYTRADAELLAGVDEAHETLSGPATQKILQREFYDFGDPRYQRLARISVAQLYRLRRSAAYRKRRMHQDSARARNVQYPASRVATHKGARWDSVSFCPGDA